MKPFNGSIIIPVDATGSLTDSDMDSIANSLRLGFWVSENIGDDERVMRDLAHQALTSNDVSGMF